MFNFKLVFFFTVFSTSSCDEIVNFVLNSLVDQSVHPCDDFYRHVCASSTKFGMIELINQTHSEELDKTFAPTDDASNYLHELLECRETPYINGTLTQKFIHQYQLACKNGDGEVFLRKVESLYRSTPYVTCNDTSQFSLYLQYQEQELMEHYQERCDSMIPYLNERLWIHQNIQVLENFKNVFEGLKNIFYDWVGDTPSFRKNNVTEVYQEMVNSTNFSDESASEYIHELTREYKKCKILLNTWIKDSDLSTIICIGNNWNNIKETNEVYDTLNARNTSFKVVMKTMNYFFGTHKRLHSKPIQKIMQVLSRNEDRLDDNGADLLGSRGSIQLAKQEFGEKFYQASEEYSNLTNAKLFFYGLGSSLCNAPGSDAFHSPIRARFNAIAAQNSEFQKAFQCGPDTKIMQSLHRKCHILGKNASPQKHSGI